MHVKPTAAYYEQHNPQHHSEKKDNEGSTYLSMRIKQELILFFMVGHPGRASRGIVSLLRLRSRMRETMGHFSSKPLTTKYRQDTQETSILPKAPLFPSPSASMAMTTDCLFI